MLHLAQLLAAAALALAAPTDAPSANAVMFAAQMGLTPESLVVAGFDATDAQSIVDSLGTGGEHFAAFSTAQSLVDAKAAALASATGALAGDPSNETLVAARNAARVQLASAQSALKALPASIRAAVLSGADSGKKSLLEVYVLGAGHACPPQFKAVSRTDAEWAALEGALRAEARATRRGEELAGDKATLLSSARTAVSPAKIRLDNTLASVKAVFTPVS